MNEQRRDDCPGQEETVFLFLDGELSPLEHAAFAAHLQSCSACQALVDEWAHFSARLATPEELPAPPGLAEVVMARIEQEPAPGTSRLGELILAGQLLVGLGLLALFGPSLVRSLVPWLRTGLATQGQLTLLLWQRLLVLGKGMGTWRPLPLEFPQTDWLALSSQLGLILVVALVLVWLLGNAVLLGPSSGRNRGPFSRAR